MHLPDGLIPLNQALVYWIICLIILGLFFYKFSKERNDKRIILLGVFASLTVIVSSVSIPSPFGIPIHFFLIPLVALILGPLNGSVVSFLALLVQSLFLAMGGLTTLGANVLTIGIVISFGTFIFYKIFLNLNKKFAIFCGTLVGIICGTFFQVLILIISGSSTLETLLASLVPFYLFVAIIEGIINLIIMTAIERISPEILTFNKF